MPILMNILREVWSTTEAMAPFLIFGFAVAGVLSVFVTQKTVERHMGGRGFLPVLKAALVGVPLPLCSCGVIPVSAALRKHGASKGATLSFLLSTPQTGVDSIMVTYGMLGGIFAIFRPIVALVTGLIGGMVIEAIEPDRSAKKESAKATPCADECCAPQKGASRLFQAIRYAFVVLPKDIAKSLLLGLVLAGLIASVVPDDFFAGQLGSGIGAMFVMMLIGIPLYVCATASVPIAAALILKGVSPGAALVFLIVGPATNMAAITTIWKIMGRRTTYVYLATVAVTALAAGLLLDHLFTLSGVDPDDCGMHTMLPHWFETASAIGLLAMLAGGLMPWGRSSHRHADKGDEAGIAATLKIGGMTCGNCVENVRGVLLKCEGVTSVEVDLKSGEARVRGMGCSREELSDAVGSLGYNVLNIS